MYSRTLDNNRTGEKEKKLFCAIANFADILSWVGIRKIFSVLSVCVHHELK